MTSTAAPTYRVVGAAGFRGEKIVAEGLTREDAHEMRDRMKADPICRGFSIWVEEENAAVDTAIAQMAGVHGGKAAHRIGEGVPAEETQEQPVETPAPVAACDGCHAHTATDELHAHTVTGKFLCTACHPAYRAVETPAPAPKATAKPARKPRRPFDALDQERRIAAAIVQSGDYDFTPHDPGTWICDGPRGSFLVTEEGGCSCEDATYTTGPVGARCKHAIMLGHRLIEMGAGLTGAPIYPTGPQDLARPVRFDREAIGSF